MGTTPPPGPPGVPPPGGAPGAGPDQPPQPASAVGSGTYSPSDAFTRYDEGKDAYHCSFGIPGPALTIWDPERELIVRLDRNTHQVVGFSIPNFTQWHKKHADEHGEFEVDLPPTYPVEGLEDAESGPAW